MTGKFASTILCAAVLCIAATAQAAVIISTAATQNENCSAGVCTPTAKQAVLNVDDLANMLTQSDVTVKTSDKAKNILVDSPFGWTSSNRLTLEAYQDIIVQQPVTAAGSGALTLTTNEGGAGGDYWFVSPGSISFWDLSSSLIINDANYTLVKDIKTLASDIAANPSGNYALADSYNASADGTYATSPIAEITNNVEGLGNTISNFNLTIKSAAPNSALGLVGTLASTGVLRDINITRANMVLKAHTGRQSVYTGILVGESRGNIIRASTGGAISGRRGTPAAGGLVGINYGTILRSFSSASITLNSGGGGGGLVVTNIGSIILSHATGAVTVAPVGPSGSAAGLASENDGKIEQCFASGAVSALKAGGLIGTDILGPGTTIQSYAVGAVTALLGPPHNEGYAGGFVWMTMGSYSQVYATGKVTGNEMSPAAGFVAYSWSPNNYSDAYWDVDTSGQTEGCGPFHCSTVIGLSDAQLKSGLPDGFDPAIWGQSPSINNGYPYLLANPPLN